MLHMGIVFALLLIAVVVVLVRSRRR